MRFPPPPRAIESAIERARPNARATALRFNSLKFYILGKVDQTVKKPTPHAGLKRVARKIIYGTSYRTCVLNHHDRVLSVNSPFFPALPPMTCYSCFPLATSSASDAMPPSFTLVLSCCTSGSSTKNNAPQCSCAQTLLRSVHSITSLPFYLLNSA